MKHQATLLLILLFITIGILAGIVAYYEKNEKKYKSMEKDFKNYQFLIVKSEYYTKVSDLIWGKDSRRCDAGLILKIERIRNEIDSSLSIDLILSLIAIESGFNKYAISKAGAVGLMQVLPSTAREIDSTIISPEQLFDEERNLRIGISYLSKLNKLFQNPDLALLAYNRGPNRTLAELQDGKLPTNYRDKIAKYKSEIK
jgi:soluble lytic murein transglycosylase